MGPTQLSSALLLHASSLSGPACLQVRPRSAMLPAQCQETQSKLSERPKQDSWVVVREAAAPGKTMAVAFSKEVCTNYSPSTLCLLL